MSAVVTVASPLDDQVGAALAWAVATERGLPAAVGQTRLVETIDGPDPIERWVVCELDDGVSVEVYLPQDGPLETATVGLWDHQLQQAPADHPLAAQIDR